jgi:Dynein heavy chain C-terminal domain/Dynein heavy chain AAA lid domain
VTDAHDRHTLMVILSDFYTPEILKDDYKFSESGTYFAPEHADHDGYLEYISTLPILPAPEAFGMHENADINKDLQEVGELLESLMLTQSNDAVGGSGKTTEEVISGIAADIVKRVPPEFDLEAVQRKYPQDYHESMNTVLVQELSRFNGLLAIVWLCPKCTLVFHEHCYTDLLRPCISCFVMAADKKVTAKFGPSHEGACPHEQRVRCCWDGALQWKSSRSLAQEVLPLPETSRSLHQGGAGSNSVLRAVGGTRSTHKILAVRILLHPSLFDRLKAKFRSQDENSNRSH